MKKQSLDIFKNVLITGGAGFIGKYMVNRFLELGATVHVVDNLYTGSPKNLPDNPNLHFYEGSILDKPFLETLSNNKFDLIIHLASVVGMRLATKYQDLVYQSATTGTSNVMEVFPGVPIVLFSSSAVYGMDNKTSVREDQFVPYEQLLKYDGGNLGYACGKWEMEQIGVRAAEAGRKVLIVRPFNVVGIGQVGTYGMVVPTFVHLALNNKPITVLDDGNQVRSFTRIDAFIECVFRLMQYEELWTVNNNIVNIGSKNGNTINDLARIVKEETNSGSEITYSRYEEFFPNHKDVTYRVPDITLGEKYYGKIEWPTLRDIVQSLIPTMR